jgi:putative ABC transport system substrate-binding protein
MFGIRRREFVALLGGAAAAWPVTARAQQAAMPVIGYMHPTSSAASANLLAAFRKGLAEAGYIENQNVAIEFRWADSHYERLSVLAQELARRQVAAIVAVGGDPVALAAKGATTTIPIIFNTGSDPVKLGLVTSLNRPGSNITGVAQLTGELGSKQLELLSELVPAADVIGLLANPANPASEMRSRELQSATQALGREIRVLNAESEDALNAAFEAMAKMGLKAFLIVGDAILLSRRDQIVALAARYSLAAVYSRSEFAEAGGLMSYGGSITDSYRLVGEATGRILNGTKPADLPVQQSTKIELVINLKTAKALGLEVPSSLLARADEVIE